MLACEQSVLREQDSSLEILGQSVGRIGEIAMGIGKEISTQNLMIEELDEDMENAQVRRDSAVYRIVAQGTFMHVVSAIHFGATASSRFFTFISFILYRRCRLSLQTNIDMVTQKTKELIKRSGGMNWFLLILFLAVLLVILTFLVIET
jgi:hypothetical protein